MSLLFDAPQVVRSALATRVAILLFFIGFLTPMVGLSAGQASGSVKATPPQSPRALPNETTSTFGNWVLRCVQVGEVGKGRVCEIFQQVQAVRSGQAVVLLNVAVGAMSSTQPLLITVGLPTNFTFSGGVRIGAKEGAQTELTFERCIGGLCFASTALADGLLRDLRGPGESGRVSYQSASGESVTIPISLQGFSQALDALILELRR